MAYKIEKALYSQYNYKKHVVLELLVSLYIQLAE